VRTSLFASDDQEGDHPLLVEVGQQLVHVQHQEVLARHGMHVGVEAVDADEAHVTPGHSAHDPRRELPR
jgi:hypothetical protein